MLGLTPSDILARLDALPPAQRAEAERLLASLSAETVPMVAYQTRPLDWMVEHMGIPRHTLQWSLNPGYETHGWDGTTDPLVAVLDALAKGQDVGVEAGVGTQKTFTAALAVFWFLAVFPNAIVETHATRGDQLRLGIWKEITDLWPRFQKLFPSAELTDLRIRMNGTDKWSAHGKTTGVRAGEASATKAQGVHAEHMLQIIEEMPGVDDAIVSAIYNTRSEHNIMLGLGNPDFQGDPLHRFCVLPDTVHIRISSLDHPNVVTGQSIVPGAQDRTGLRRLGAKYPEGTAMHASRVRGISPSESADALIKMAWVDAAAERYERMHKAAIERKDARAMGVDVANSEDGDKAARADGIGACLERVRTTVCPDSNVLGSEIFAEANTLGIDPSHIGVDPVGVGAGTVNEMVRLGMNPQRLGGSLRPVSGAMRAADGGTMEWVPDSNRFVNLRGQMYWSLREALRLGQIAIEPSIAERLGVEFTAMWFEDIGGKVVLPDKAQIIKRLGHSPDAMDSIVYWQWCRPRSAENVEDDIGENTLAPWDLKAKRRMRKQPLVGPDGQITSRSQATEPVTRYGLGGLEPVRMPRYGTAEEDES